MTRADGHAEREAAKVMINDARQAADDASAEITLGADKGLRRTGIYRSVPADEGHTVRCAKHLGAEFVRTRYDCLECGLRHFATKAQADRTRFRVGQDRGAHTPSDGARVEEGGPDVRVEHGRLQPRAHALVGTGPPVVAKCEAIRPEIGLDPLKNVEFALKLHHAIKLPAGAA